MRVLSVGDTVVYAAHGVGRVVAREPRSVAGTERECVVVDLAAGLRITLAVDEAAERLRAVADDDELESVREILGGAPARRDGPWTRRIKESKEKLASGRPVDLAELVRDGGPFDRRDGAGRLSPGERRVYLRARQLLVREICSARGLAEDEADAWIERQVEPVNGDGR